MTISTARLKDRIAQLDEEYSIFLIKTQKSYTSIASFLDGAIYLLMARNPKIFIWSVKKKAFNSDLSRCVAGVGVCSLIDNG